MSGVLSGEDTPASAGLWVGAGVKVPGGPRAEALTAGIGKRSSLGLSSFYLEVCCYIVVIVSAGVVLFLRQFTQ